MARDSKTANEGDNNPQPDDKASEHQQQSSKGAEPKQGNISEDDVRQEKKFKVAIKGVTGEIAGTKFNDENIARDVSPAALQKLQTHFGGRAVRVLDEY